MRCAVTLLRRQGLRLRSAELEPPIVGDLELTDHEGASTFRRDLRVANLWADTHSVSRRSLVVPLWDPVVLRIGPDTLTLCGIELSSDEVGQRVAECVQIWRCTLRP
jgi:hypothetical protein